MDRSTFARQFRAAAEQARDFGRRFIEEPLPDAMRFRVRLGAPQVLEEGSNVAVSDGISLAAKDLEEAEVVALLWRDGFVPFWVDIQVVGETGDASILGLTLCGRYTDDEALLYYGDSGLGAFGPKGPSLPPACLDGLRYLEGTRFSIHDRHECWSLDALAHALKNRAKVRSLELHGHVFDDDVLRTLSFPRLDVLALTDVRIDGTGLAGLAGLPRLRALRATLRETDALDFASVPTTPLLESLTIRMLPNELSAIHHLAASVPCLRELALASITKVRADAVIELPGLELLSLELPAIPDFIEIPESLRKLYVHIREATDADIARYLGRCPEHLEELGLRDTPVSDAIFEALGRFEHLRYLDIEGTRMTSTALRRFADARPGFRCTPKENPTRARRRS